MTDRAYFVPWLGLVHSISPPRTACLHLDLRYQKDGCWTRKCRKNFGGAPPSWQAWDSESYSVWFIFQVIIAINYVFVICCHAAFVCQLLSSCAMHDGQVHSRLWVMESTVSGCTESAVLPPGEVQRSWPSMLSWALALGIYDLDLFFIFFFECFLKIFFLLLVFRFLLSSIVFLVQIWSDSVTILFLSSDHCHYILYHIHVWAPRFIH